jgi:type I restriction enzyme S subunit
MGEWKEFRLSEVGKLERGRSRHRPRYAFHLYGGSYPFIQTGEIRAANKYITSFDQTYNEEGLAQSRLWPAGTLCITIAANIAEVAILRFDACFPNSVLGFIPDDKKTDLDFVFYTLKYFQKELQTFGDGSVQDNINLGTFEQIRFPFPLLSEQRAIASILSSLDDKIDLLQRQNKTLEQMAETLFRQWFVEEAKESWREITLREIADHVKESINPSKQPNLVFSHYSVPAYDEGREPKKELGKDILSNKYLVISDSILISKLNPKFPRVWPIFGQIDETLSICSTEFQVVRPKNKSYFGFIYCFLKSQTVFQELQNAVGGTSESHQRVDLEIIFDLSFPIPLGETVEEFAKLTNDYWFKIDENFHQIRTLTQLRDTLLPKLMSGEVRVKIN